ncbi:MAG: hypothetical protein K0Q48_359 [Bacillota bacterium]|nr:hypothetical protein [Bacillota bacterium]
MNEFPDVLGMELHDAAALLESEGLAFIIAETKPAKKELDSGELRVIRIKLPDRGASLLKEQQNIILTVCRI